MIFHYVTNVSRTTPPTTRNGATTHKTEWLKMTADGLLIQTFAWYDENGYQLEDLGPKVPDGVVTVLTGRGRESIGAYVTATIEHNKTK